MRGNPAIQLALHQHYNRVDSITTHYGNVRLCSANITVHSVPSMNWMWMGERQRLGTNCLPSKHNSNWLQMYGTWKFLALQRGAPQFLDANCDRHPCFTSCYNAMFVVFTTITIAQRRRMTSNKHTLADMVESIHNRLWTFRCLQNCKIFLLICGARRARENKFNFISLDLFISHQTLLLCSVSKRRCPHCPSHARKVTASKCFQSIDGGSLHFRQVF